MNEYKVFLDGEHSVVIKADYVYSGSVILTFYVRETCGNKEYKREVASFNMDNILGYRLIKIAEKK